MIARKCNIGNDSLSMTTNIDLNLLLALDALLQEVSVTRAARRARLTTPAMSRALGRLRAALGDDLLVRAGRSMVLTPLARSLRDRAHLTAADAIALLSPASSTKVADLDRTLVIRCNDAVAAIIVAPLARAAQAEAPRVRFQFAQEGEEDAGALRDGRVDLDLGVIDFVEPELRRQHLVRDRYVGLVRRGHALCKGRVSARRFAAQGHVGVSRRGRFGGPIDEALAKRGLTRTVVATVPDFLAAAHAVARSDLATAVPSRLAQEAARALALAAFPLPIAVPEIAVAMAWHPRVDNDPVHRWLRSQLRSLFA